MSTNYSIVIRYIFFAMAIFAGITAVGAQSKPWTEWDKKEVEKRLNNSPWGQTQAETDTSEMTVTFGRNNQPDSANNQALTFNYRIRLFSAKPIREAFARKVVLENPSIKPAQLEGFINGDYSEMVVVAVTYDGPDRRFLGPLDAAFKTATTATIGNKTYLERGDGKRVELAEYSPPAADGTGAKFVFPRVVDGKPFISANDEFVRFISEMGRGVKMSWRFKVSDMMYNGNLEY